MVEGLGLGLCGRRGSQGSLGLCGGGGLGEELDLFLDSTAKVVEGLADVGGIIVGFVGVLGAGGWGRTTRQYGVYSCESWIGEGVSSEATG